VGGFGYGVTRGQVDVRIFDGFDVEHWRWLSTDGVLRRCRMPFNVIDPDGIDCGLGNVPLLYAGPWQGFDHAASLAEGPSTLAGHVREGIVVRPAEPRFDARCGRVLFKLHGRGFLLKREG
jgi:hypothetical protein